MSICRSYEYPAHTCWISTSTGGEAEHPQFGGATSIYNVIDSRQADPQSNVIEALRGLGYVGEASRYTHFSYGMVALTPRCAMELGYAVSPEDQARPYIEVSGRKGFGVKADDLIDQLIAASRKEVDARHPELSEEERQTTATQIAVGALRYFMLKFTRNTVIAFDFREALSFEGETGPYVQYAIVRARNILRKAETTSGDGVGENLRRLILRRTSRAKTATGSGSFGCGRRSCTSWSSSALRPPSRRIWRSMLFSWRRSSTTSTTGTMFCMRRDEARKTFLLATAAVAERELVRALALLGIDAPEVM